MTCELCAKETRKLVIYKGQFLCPFCYDNLRFEGVERHHHAAFRDEIPGGITLENYGPKPMTFYTHSERRAYMASQGLHEMEKCCPFPGTDKDPQGIPNPKGYVDAYTLAAGAALICRNGAQEPEFDGAASGVLGESFNLTGTERDAIAVARGDTGRSSRIGRRIKNASVNS
jgi:hypothetical protein